MQAKDVIVGRLNSLSQNITGALSASDILCGSMVSSNFISGSLISEITLSGNVVIPPEKYVDPYKGEYIVQSKPFEDEILMTKAHSMTKNLTVLKIPYYETSNETGYTVYIGGE